jgi:hypothetical protein
MRMILGLLLQTIAKEAQEQAESDKGKLLNKVLEERLVFHLEKLGGITEERRQERDALVKAREKSKHITMNDLHEGFESKVITSWSFLETFPTLSTVRSPRRKRLQPKACHRRVTRSQYCQLHSSAHALSIRNPGPEHVDDAHTPL